MLFFANNAIAGSCGVSARLYFVGSRIVTLLRAQAGFFSLEGQLRAEGASCFYALLHRPGSDFFPLPDSFLVSTYHKVREKQIFTLVLP